MILSSFRLASFRNHLDSRLETRGRKAVLLEGPNGAGKTSVLEAIHLLATGIGFRTRRDADLARFGSDGYRLDAVAPEFDLTLRYRADAHREAILRGAPLARWSDMIGRIWMTALRPDDLALVEGAPAERRRFLDVMLCQKERPYFDSLRRWKRAWKQRQRGDARDRAVAASFAALALEEMPRLFAARARTCDELDRHARMIREELALSGVLAVVYRPAIPKRCEPGDWETAAKLCLQEARRCEALGLLAPCGPGRDELDIALDGVPLRTFGSQGQKRLAALVLRLAEARFLSADDHAALVLVDDVLGELDAERKNAFLGVLSRVPGQIWLADTSTKIYEECFQNRVKFDIKSGTVQGAKYP